MFLTSIGLKVEEQQSTFELLRSIQIKCHRLLVTSFKSVNLSFENNLPLGDIFLNKVVLQRFYES
jgi:hypothetical protein